MFLQCAPEAFVGKNDPLFLNEQNISLGRLIEIILLYNDLELLQLSKNVYLSLLSTYIFRIINVQSQLIHPGSAIIRKNTNAP